MYQEMELKLREELPEIENRVKVLQYEDTLDNWKKHYRRISTGEI